MILEKKGRWKERRKERGVERIQIVRCPTFIQKPEDSPEARMVALYGVCVELQYHTAARGVVLFLHHGDVSTQFILPQCGFIHLGPLQVQKET